MTPILIIFGLVLAGLLLVNVASRKPTEVKAIEFCNAHTWVYTHLGEMICDDCGYKPRDNQ